MKIILFHEYILNLSILGIYGQTKAPTKIIAVNKKGLTTTFVSVEGFFDPETSTYNHPNIDLTDGQIDSYIEKPLLLDREIIFPLLNKDENS